MTATELARIPSSEFRCRQIPLLSSSVAANGCLREGQPETCAVFETELACLRVFADCTAHTAVSAMSFPSSTCLAPPVRASGLRCSSRIRWDYSAHAGTRLSAPCPTRGIPCAVLPSVGPLCHLSAARWRRQVRGTRVRNIRPTVSTQGAAHTSHTLLPSADAAARTRRSIRCTISPMMARPMRKYITAYGGLACSGRYNCASMTSTR